MASISAMASRLRTTMSTEVLKSTGLAGVAIGVAVSQSYATIMKG